MMIENKLRWAFCLLLLISISSCMDLVTNIEPETKTVEDSEISFNNVTWNDIRFLKGETNNLELDSNNQSDYACLISYDAQFDNKYTYGALWLHFPDAILNDAKGEETTIIYKLSIGDNRETNRFARCTIPASDEALTFMQNKLRLTVSDTDNPSTNDSRMNDEENDMVIKDCISLIPFYEYIYVGGEFILMQNFICVGEGFGDDPNPIWPPNEPLEETGGGDWNPGGNEDDDPCSDPNSLLLPASCMDVPEAPCIGNPVKNPRIAPQDKSGMNGGRFGDTRSAGNQFHSGIDVRNEIGDPFYSPFSGNIDARGHNDELGYFITIRFLVDGVYHFMRFGHLQDNGRPANGAPINAGTVIGYQGLSGNLEIAIDRGYTNYPHSHIMTGKRVGSGWDHDDDYELINPESILTTKFNENGNPIFETDC